ncbi:uncharacterized protein LOC128923452 [Zeugodacus cucurbitae]|uniref:uncharacterized protein LOC128923452 n=1 Tax=Zeugodacus cucurbitae TaxID=28588 RepID=UPI0023D96E04|nr:uncharacterized protein LOC128923452 [Zeugodacus cucurbitae]
MLICIPIPIEMDVEDVQIISETLRSEKATPIASAAPVAAPRTTVMRSSSAAAVRETREEQLLEDQGPPRCRLCHRPHALKRCPIFLSMKPAQRQQIARAHGHCMMCLADDHATNECWADQSCRQCHKPHHTLFHQFARRPNPTLTRTRQRQHRDPVQRRKGNRSETTRVARSRPFSPRHEYHRQHRRPTGLSAVVSTLQQLQRLLGN